MALTLEGKGVTSVVVLKGGLAAWQRAGYPLEVSTPTPAAAIPTLPPGTPGAVAGVAVLGRPDAPVTIEEFSDFQ